MMKIKFGRVFMLAFFATQVTSVRATDLTSDWTGYLEASNPTRHIYAKLHLDAIRGEGCKAIYFGSFEWGGVLQSDGSAKANNSLGKPAKHMVSGITACENGKRLVKFKPGRWITYPPAPIPPFSFEGEFENENVFSGADDIGRKLVLTAETK